MCVLKVPDAKEALAKALHVEKEDPLLEQSIYSTDVLAPLFFRREHVVEAKANVNHQLKNADALKALYEEGGEYLLEMVGSFTPYIYSLRYASKEVTDYLLANGADSKALPETRYQEWVQHTAKP